MMFTTLVVSFLVWGWVRLSWISVRVASSSTTSSVITMMHGPINIRESSAWICSFNWAELLLNRFHAACSASLIGSLKMISTYSTFPLRIWQFETDIPKMSCCGLNCWNFHIIFTDFSPDVRIVACFAHRVQRETCILEISSVRTWCLYYCCMNFDEIRYGAKWGIYTIICLENTVVLDVRFL